MIFPTTSSFTVVARAVAAGAALAMSAGCSKPTTIASSSAVRLVQETMRAELRARWLQVDQPTPDTIRLTFQDEGLRKASPAARAIYARAAAARALQVLAPPPGRLPADLRVVLVRIERTGRLGPLVWSSGTDRYTLPVHQLRRMGNDPAPAGTRLSARA